MTATDLVTTMLRHSDRGDFEAFRALLDPDCEWVNPMIQARGAQEIAENVAAYSAAFPRRRHDVSRVIVAGENLAVEGHWIATHESGVTVDVPFAAIMREHGGRIAAVRLYIDTAAFMAQLEVQVTA